MVKRKIADIVIVENKASLKETTVEEREGSYFFDAMHKGVNKQDWV